VRRPNPNQSLVLDCDFCDNIEHFANRMEAVDKGWNWMESGMKDDTEFSTVACCDCDADQVSDLHRKKEDLITYSDSPKPPEATRNDPAQTKIGGAE